MASHFIKEDDTYIYVYKYVHANDDEISDWFLDENNDFKYDEQVLWADESVGYEVKIIYRINKNTHEVVIDEIVP